MTIPNMVKSTKTAGDILSVRLKSLIGEGNLRGAPMRIEKDAARRNLTVTHSTLQRMLTGEGAHLDKLEDVAAYFGKEVWELLCPASGVQRLPTLPQALEVVIAAITALPQPKRKALAEDLALLAVAPGDPETKQRVVGALHAEPSIANKLLAVPSQVESPRLPKQVAEK